MALHRSEQNPGFTPARAVDVADPLQPSLRYLGSARKRALDILVGSFGIMLLAIMLVPVAIVIKRSSPGPVFYRQRRVGRNGVEFDLVKFRTMAADAEAACEFCRV